MNENLEQDLRRVLRTQALTNVPDTRPIPPRGAAAESHRAHPAWARRWAAALAGAAAVAAFAAITVTVGRNTGHAPSSAQLPGTTVSTAPPGGQTRIHRNIADGCSPTIAHAADVVGVRNEGTDLAARLLPAASATAGLICAYTADNRVPTPVPMLSKFTRLDPNHADELAAAIAQISLQRQPDGIKCPLQTSGSVTLIILSYQRRPDVDLWYKTSGCQTLSNGVTTAYQGANPSFYTTFSTVFDRLTQ